MKNEALSPEDPMSEFAKVDPREMEPVMDEDQLFACPRCGAPEEECLCNRKDEPDAQLYDGYEGQWPGDGSGMDDFADYNAAEADDYMNE